MRTLLLGVFLIGGLTGGAAPAWSDAWSWSDTTSRPCEPGQWRWAGPIEPDLTKDYPAATREISCWSHIASGGKVRDGLCIVADSAGRPVTEGYFERGHRVGGWVTWSAGRVRQEWWSGGSAPDSITAEQPDHRILLLDVRATWKGSGHKDAGGSEVDCDWSQSPAGPDTTAISWSMTSIVYQSAVHVFHVPRRLGILLVRRDGLICPDFSRVLGPWFYQDGGMERRGRPRHR